MDGTTSSNGKVKWPPAQSLLTVALLLIVHGANASDTVNMSPCNDSAINPTVEYTYWTAKRTWSKAELHCQEMGGHLILPLPTYHACYMEHAQILDKWNHWISLTTLLYGSAIPEDAKFRDVSSSNVALALNLHTDLNDDCAIKRKGMLSTRPWEQGCSKSYPYICGRRIDASTRYPSQVCKGNQYFYHSISFSNGTAAEACRRVSPYAQRISFLSDEQIKCASRLITSHRDLAANHVNRFPVYVRHVSTEAGCSFLDTNSSSTPVRGNCTDVRPVVCVAVFCNISLNEVYTGDTVDTRRCVCKPGTTNTTDGCVAVGKLMVKNGLTRGRVASTVITYLLDSTSNIWNNGRLSLENTKITDTTLVDDVVAGGHYIVIAHAEGAYTAVFINSRVSPADQKLIVDGYTDSSNIVSVDRIDENGSRIALADNIATKHAWYRTRNEGCRSAPTTCAAFKLFKNPQDLPAGEYEMRFAGTGKGVPQYTLPIPFTSMFRPTTTLAAALTSSFTSISSSASGRQPQEVSSSNTGLIAAVSVCSVIAVVAFGAAVIVFRKRQAKSVPGQAHVNISPSDTPLSESNNNYADVSPQQRKAYANQASTREPPPLPPTADDIYVAPTEGGQ